MNNPLAHIGGLNHAERLNTLLKLKINYLLADYVFSDESKNFVIPCEPDIGDDVTIRLRAAKGDPDSVYIHINGEKREMRHQEDSGLFTYYYCVMENLRESIEYYFSLVKNGKIYYYNKRGLYPYLADEYNFRVIPGFQTPDWAKGAVMYQIYTDRFYNGDKSNDVAQNEYAYLSGAAKTVPWDTPVAERDVCNFYGGDLQGIMDKLDYLQGLGIEAIFLNPVFVSPSNHKYDIQDYDYVDPHLGVIAEDGGDTLSMNNFSNKFATKYLKRTTDIKNLEASNGLLAKLIEEAHKRGIKVILDGVFNHCGSFNKWLDKEGFYQRAGYPFGAYLRENSPYHKYFHWYDRNWPGNDCYDCWWGHLNHPKLNYEDSPELFERIMEIGKKWVSPPYNADGWRLDVAADLGRTQEFNHKFWESFRGAVKSANPEAIILAEHYGDPSPWLKGNQWDTIMNYDAFMEPVSWFFTGMEKHSDEFRYEHLKNAMFFEDSMRRAMSRFTIQSQNTAMNQLSNHDHSRFLTRTNKTTGRLASLGSKAAETGIKKELMYAAALLLMTWPGAPAIYYGDEAGLCGFTDPDNRRPYPWGREDKTLIAFHREIIKFRRKYQALRDGSLEYLYNNYGILSFCRFDESACLAIAININDTEEEINLPVWKSGAGETGLFKSLIHARNGGFDKAEIKYPVKNGRFKIKMMAQSAVLLVQEREG